MEIFCYVLTALPVLNYEYIGGFVLLFVLLLCSALVSGSEAAFFSLSPQNIEDIKKRKNKTSECILHLLEKQDYLLATVLIFNNFINIAIILISAFLVHNFIDFAASPVLGFVVEVIVITFVLLLFGELIPKVLAASSPVSFASFMARPLNVMRKMVQPLGWLLVSSSSRVNNKLSNLKSSVSIGDLSDAIEFTDKSIGDKKILKGIVEITNIDVKDIMRPRIDIDAVEINTDFEKLYKFVVDCGYSRIPIFEDSFDNVKGILYVKDLLPYTDQEKDFAWQSLIGDAYFVPENKKINDLLEEFQKKSIHMAIVVDEYGGTSGMVTLEDILEEIVGEISDENDETEKLFVRLQDKSYLFEGKTLLNDFCKVMSIDNSFFDDIMGDAETIGGLIIEATGEIPPSGYEFIFKQFKFIVDSNDNKRIKKVRVIVAPQDENN